MKSILYHCIATPLIAFAICGWMVTAESADTESNHDAGHEHHANHSGPKPSSVMSQARTILDRAELLEQSAVLQIQHANRTRKLIKKFRVEERKLTDEAASESLKGSTDALAEQIELWQQSSVKLRETSTTLRETAHSLFVVGFTEVWSDWISNAEPLTVDPQGHETMAHNNQIRSAHPTMKELTPSTEEMPEKHEGMTMRVPDMSSQPSTEDLNTTTFQLSRDRNFLAHIEVDPGTGSDAETVPINEIHHWRLIVSDLDGNAVKDATIELVGHMPGHVHGLPTQPRITDQLADGVYRVEGVKFQMAGWWVIEFNISDGDITDTVKFDILL